MKRAMTGRRFPNAQSHETGPAGDGAEEWRPAVGLEGHYDVSSLGRVRRKSNGRILRQLDKVKRDGKLRYTGVEPCVGGRRHQLLTHVMVARAFLGPCPAGLEIDHVNGDRRDNRAANLEYVTRSENQLRSLRMRGKTGPSGPVAQRTERLPPKKDAAGSIPARVTTARKRLAAAFRRAGVPLEQVPTYLARVDHIVDAVMLSGPGVALREGAA